MESKRKDLKTGIGYKISNFFNKTLRIILSVGIFEKIKLKKVFNVDSASYISAFSLELPLQEFEAYYIKRMPQLLGKKFSYDTQMDLVKLFCLNYRGDTGDVYESLYCSIIDKFEKVESKKYSVDRWRTLTCFFISNGMFRLADICRVKGEENLLNRKYCWGDEWRKAIVYIQNRQFDKASSFIKKVEENCIFNKFFSEEIYTLKLYYQLLMGETIDKKDYTDREKEFLEIVQQKEILIIGPAPLNNGISFGKRDYVVIRNNEHRERETEYLDELRTDISYYNGAALKWVLKNRQWDFFEQFKYVVLKHRCDWKDGFQRVRKTLEMDEIFFVGSMNVLPIMVMDLWQFSIKSIYICGNNLYLSKKPYHKNYIGADVRKKKYADWNGFSVHNMFSQLLFLKNAYISGRIIPDEELKRVIELPTWEYAKKMEEIYVLKK